MRNNEAWIRQIVCPRSQNLKSAKWGFECKCLTNVGFSFPHLNGLFILLHLTLRTRADSPTSTPIPDFLFCQDTP